MTDRPVTNPLWGLSQRLPRKTLKLRWRCSAPSCATPAR